MWMLMAVLSAFFAGVSAVLAKCGIRKTDSDVATAIRTLVMAVFAWGVVILTGEAGGITSIEPFSMIFVVLSGLVTAASWICYFKALATGDVNKVVPIEKASTVLGILMAIVIFNETNHLWLKLISSALLALGIVLMVEKSSAEASTPKDKKWLIYAFAAAILAALTSIFGKIGSDTFAPNLGTAIRTCIVVAMAWAIILINGKYRQLGSVDRRELGFIMLSGITTGASWLCYYNAITDGVVSIVVPVDKLSIIVSVVFSYIVFREKLSLRAFIGLMLMIAGTLLMALFT